MAQTTHYETLGLANDASAAAIKRAYRALARRHHPDAAPGDAGAETRFKAISEAYAILSDPAKRAAYDASLREPAGRSRARVETAAGDFDFADLFGDAFDPADFAFAGVRFADLFGVRQAGPAVSRARLTIDLARAYSGGEVEVAAGGRSIRVTLPAGIAEGDRVRVAGAGRGGTDLELEVVIRPDGRFERTGHDLRTSLTIGLRLALLGGSRRISTPGGRVEMRIPAGTQPGQVIRLRGRGMPRRGAGGHGDLFVTLSVRLPELRTPRMRSAAERLLDEIEPGKD